MAQARYDLQEQWLYQAPLPLLTVGFALRALLLSSWSAPVNAVLLPSFVFFFYL